MEADRFDALLRRLSVTASRRTTLRRLLAGAFGVTPMGGAAARCGPCERTVNGRCRPKPNGTACGACKVCQKGRCRNRPDDTACADDGRCLGGRCIARPEGCAAAGTNCASSGALPCCSERCVQQPDGSFDRCGPGAPGTPCLSGADCHSAECVGYRCTKRGCDAGDDGCQDPAKTCGNLGICLRRVQGGTRCGVTWREETCEQDCLSDEQCRQRTDNPNAFCAFGGRPGAHPLCICDGGTFCAVPR